MAVASQSQNNRRTNRWPQNWFADASSRPGASVRCLKEAGEAPQMSYKFPLLRSMLGPTIDKDQPEPGIALSGHWHIVLCKCPAHESAPNRCEDLVARRSTFLPLLLFATACF